MIKKYKKRKVGLLAHELDEIINLTWWILKKKHIIELNTVFICKYDRHIVDMWLMGFILIYLMKWKETKKIQQFQFLLTIKINVIKLSINDIKKSVLISISNIQKYILYIL